MKGSHLDHKKEEVEVERVSAEDVFVCSGHEDRGTAVTEDGDEGRVCDEGGGLL